MAHRRGRVDLSSPGYARTSGTQAGQIQAQSLPTGAISNHSQTSQVTHGLSNSGRPKLVAQTGGPTHCSPNQPDVLPAACCCNAARSRRVLGTLLCGHICESCWSRQMGGLRRLSRQASGLLCNPQGNKLQHGHVIDAAMQHTASHNVAANGREPILGSFVRGHIDGASARSFIFDVRHGRNCCTH